MEFLLSECCQRSNLRLRTCLLFLLRFEDYFHWLCCVELLRYDINFRPSQVVVVELFRIRIFKRMISVLRRKNHHRLMLKGSRDSLNFINRSTLLRHPFRLCESLACVQIFLILRPFGNRKNSTVSLYPKAFRVCVKDSHHFNGLTFPFTLFNFINLSFASFLRLLK